MKFWIFSIYFIWKKTIETVIKSYGREGRECHGDGGVSPWITMSWNTNETVPVPGQNFCNDGKNKLFSLE
jgi:hypothetical protein